MPRRESVNAGTQIGNFSPLKPADKINIVKADPLAASFSPGAFIWDAT
jgi:hypothetical protein